jgi:hypothetical protein
VRAFSICLSLLMLVVSVGVVGAEALHRVTPQSSQTDLTGTWTGTWDGAGTGGFELTLEKGKDGKLGGQVSVTGEPTYKATLKTLTIEGQKMNATYDFPPDESVEVTLTATFDGNTAKGTWAAIQKGGGELASGTWTVAKK